ncbi:MAG: hypothetical protein AVDCRST_MAG93-364 [uncultured Chloroflexia bacterium]|uniref:Uncharacterized protein n=1 Tax=uncultured Chloroflexia bacterium TaxID=1672391 RepID=A0A6J4HBM0_9CHLR|nr:MAG: hypothetical protein AVDCRST_MAG93-364 [uncultured Chloroflexia bacterium]
MQILDTLRKRAEKSKDVARDTGRWELENSSLLHPSEGAESSGWKVPLLRMESDLTPYSGSS